LGERPGLRMSGKLVSDRLSCRKKLLPGLELGPESLTTPPLLFPLEVERPACLTLCMTVRAAWIGGLNVILGEIIGELLPAGGPEPEPFLAIPTSKATSCNASESDADDVPDVSKNTSVPSDDSCLNAVTSFVCTTYRSANRAKKN
jgi:hypothetical protein